MANGFSTRTGQGGFTGGAQKHDMAMDPTFAGDFGASTMAGATDAEIEALMGSGAGVVTDEDLMNQAIAKQNQLGHPIFTSWNQPSQTKSPVAVTAPYDDIIGSSAGLNQARIRNSEAVMRAKIDPVVASLKAKIANFIQSLTPEEGWGSKIMEAVPFTTTFTPASQSFNPFKTEWAQKNLYGTPVNETVIGNLPNQSTAKQAIDAQAWVAKNYPSEDTVMTEGEAAALQASLSKQQADAWANLLADEQTTSQKVAAGAGDWSQNFQTPTQNLANTLNMSGGGDTVMTEQEAAALQARLGNQQADAWANLLSQEDIPGVTSTQGTLVDEDTVMTGEEGAALQARLVKERSDAWANLLSQGSQGLLNTQPQIDTFAGMPLSTGTMATEEFDSPTALAGTPVQVDMGTGGTEGSNVVGRFENTDEGGKQAVALMAHLESQGIAASITQPTQGTDGQFAVTVDSGLTLNLGGQEFNPFNVDVNQAMQEATDITSGVDSFSGMPTTTGTAGDPLADKQSYMDFMNTLNAQPIGSSPLAPVYNEAYNYKRGADFPGNTGINAAGTSFPTQPPLVKEELFEQRPSENKMDEEFWSRPLPWVDARTVTGDAQRDLARQWEGVEEEVPEAISHLVDVPKVKTKEKVKTVTKSKYGGWKGKFNIDKKWSAKKKNQAKEKNLQDYYDFQKAWMEDFNKIKDNNLRNKVMRTDAYTRAYRTVNPSGMALGSALMLGKVGGGIQSFLTKQGLGSTETLDQTVNKVQSGEYQQGEAELPPPDPRDKVTGGFWGLINFAKKNPKIFGSLSGDELWALVSEEKDFWKFYEAALNA